MSDDDVLREIKTELVAIKKLLIVALQKQGVQGNSIATALGISQGRLSQIAATKKYKRKENAEKN